MKEIIKANLLYIFILITIVIYTLIFNTIDMDYWARLLQGNSFFETGNILKVDPYSYTQTHLWLDHEWGSSIIFSFIQKHFGFKGILALRSLIVFSIFLIIYRAIHLNIKKRNYILEILLFIIAVESIPTIVQSGIRCHFFTFLFFSLYIYILEYVRKNQEYKILYILPIIMLFWGNMHGGCVSGLGLIFMYAIGEYLNKKKFLPYIYTLIISFATLFINPYGIEYVKFIFFASTMPRPYVTEWISPFMHPDIYFMFTFKLFYIFTLLLFLINLKRIKTDYTKYIVVFACLLISFKYVKNTPFIIIASLIYFYGIIESITEKYINRYKIILIITIVIYLTHNMYYLKNNYEKYFLDIQPVKVVEFIRINDLGGKILSPFDMGSYIAYKLYPNNLIYMDGRYEEVYYKETKELLDNFYNVKKDGYKILEGKNRPDYIIVPVNALINDYLMNRKDYKLIYRNELNCLYSSTDKLKRNYIKPTNNEQYYIDKAFKTGIKN